MHIALKAFEHLTYCSKSDGTTTRLGHFLNAIAIGSPVVIPYFLAGIDFATTIPTLDLGSPPMQEGISRKSASPF